MEAEPPGWPGGEEVLAAGQPAEEALHRGQAGDAARMPHGRHPGHRDPEVEADHRRARELDGVENPDDVSRERVEVEAGVGCVAGAQATQVDGDDPVVPGEGGDNRFPDAPGVRPAVDQDDGGAVAGDRAVRSARPTQPEFSAEAIPRKIGRE